MLPVITVVAAEPRAALMVVDRRVQVGIQVVAIVALRVVVQPEAALLVETQVATPVEVTREMPVAILEAEIQEE